MIVSDELGAHAELKRLRNSSSAGRAYSADDRPAARLLMKPPLRQRLARSRSVIVIWLLMLALWAAVRGVGYLWNLAVPR
jgi:hypothetical protein